MPDSATDFHTNRRAFIMIWGAGLIVAPRGADISHEQMLQMIGIPSVDITRYLTMNPRGYFMNGELCLYQGCDMTPGTEWKLDEWGYKTVQKYLQDLRTLFYLQDDTPVYLGVRVGKIGDVWEKIRKTNFKTLEKQNIVM